MSRFPEREVGKHSKSKDKAKAGLARAYVAVSRAWRDAYGEIPLPQPKGKPQKETKETPRPVDLKEIAAKCVDRYVGLGFHIVAYPGLFEEEAIEKYRQDFTLPKDAKMPKEYEVRFPVVNAVDPRIPIPEKDRRAGIKEWINTGNITDQIHIPNKPYIVFTHDGTLYLPYTVNQAIGRYTEDEVGEPLTETVDLYLNHPEFFRTRGRDSTGSRAGSGNIPYLYSFYGNPEVYAFSADLPDRRWGAGSRGKVIIVLGS